MSIWEDHGQQQGARARGAKILSGLQGGPRRAGLPLTVYQHPIFLYGSGSYKLYSFCGSVGVYATNVACMKAIYGLWGSGCVWLKHMGLWLCAANLPGAPRVQAKSGPAAKGARRFPIGCHGPARLFLVGVMCRYHVFAGLARGCII